MVRPRVVLRTSQGRKVSSFLGVVSLDCSGWAGFFHFAAIFVFLHVMLGGDRSRDVFPLPFLSESPLRNQKLSHGTARRIHKSNAVTGRVNKAVLALNSMYFGSSKIWGKSVVDNISDLPLVQQDAMRHLMRSIKQLGPPPSDACSQGAMNALQAAGSSYDEPSPDVGLVVNMELDKLSLPSGNVANVRLHDNLTGPIRDMMVDVDNHLLQDASLWTDIEVEASKIKTYDDPLLCHRQGYLGFLRQLFKSGVLGFTSTVRGRVGAFAVSKKPKLVEGKTVERQRLVLDCRAVNLQFRDPPRTELGSLASLSEMFIPEGSRLYVATADIQDCFYACDCPAGLEQFFCLQHDIDLSEALDVTGDNFDFSGFDGCRIAPCIKVLPMGFNWSFYLVQVLHEQAAISALGTSRKSVFLDGYPSPILSFNACCTMPYCDNVHVLSFNPDLCQSGKECVAERLEEMGFTLHEHTSASTLTQTLGGVVDGDVGEVRGTSRRLWSLIFAFEYIQKSVVSTVLIQKLLGHAMCVCSFNRSGISVFRRLYDFVQSDCPPRRLNEGEILECKIFAGIVPLLTSDLRRPFSSTVTASDASPTGWGLCERELHVDDVACHARWQERWRFRRLDPCEWRPRERALNWDPFVDSRTVRGGLDTFEDLDQYVENEIFPEIPHSILEAKDWATVGMGKWRFSNEHITMKEARSLLIAVRRLSRARRHRNKRHLILLDNIALCFAVGKGRSSRFDMLRVLQQIGAISLACCLTLRPRWIPSEWNIADGPSRGQYAAGPYIKTCQANLSKGDQSNSGESTEGRPFKGGPQLASYGKVKESADHQRQESGSSRETSPEKRGSSRKAFSSVHSSEHSTGRDWHFGSAEEVDSFRDKVCEQRSESAIRQLLPAVRGLLQGERIPLATRVRRHRPPVSGLHGCSLLGEKIATRRRKDLCSRGIQHVSNKRQAFEDQEMPERMAKGRPCSESSSITKIGNVWGGHAVSSSWKLSDGLEDSGGLHSLSSPRRGHRHQEKKCDRTSGFCRTAVSMGHGGDQGHRGSETRQSGDLRQQLGHRSEGSSLGRSGALGIGKISSHSGQSSVRVSNGRFQKSFCQGRAGAELRKPSSLSTSSWRCHRRSSNTEKGIQCDQGKGQVEDRFQHETLCQDRQNTTVVREAVIPPSPVLPVVREEFTQGVCRNSASKESISDVSSVDVFTMQNRPRRFCLEIFAGTARVSQALQNQGISAFPVDIDLFPSHNVLDPQISHRILNWIQSNRILLVWLGVPCTTFSRARRFDGIGPPPLRSSEYIWGLNNLKKNDAKKLIDGNKLFAFTMKVISLCEQHSIPYILENPLTSMAWEMPPLVSFISRYSPSVADLDFCVFGELWKKPTRLLYKYIDISSLAVRCQGTFSKCSHSKRPHFALSGRDAHGIFWTLRAQPYPFALVSKFALIAATALRETRD